VRNISINGKEYSFVPNAMKDGASRESYFSLVQKVFGLNFKPWHQTGFSGNHFIPYTLFVGDIAVSSVGVVVNDFKLHDTSKRYIQISTVVTDHDYRKQGLSKWLMDIVLREWKDNCDCIYLYANDSVIDFYPKFEFIPAYEYSYRMPILKTEGTFRKLDLSIKNDADLLIKKHNESNPFSLLTMDKGFEMMMFHCITFLYDNIYYIEKYDAIVIAEQENNDMFCYDIYSSSHCDINDLLGVIASENTSSVILGFTPKDATGYSITKSNEDNTTFFVLDGMENILADNKVTLPFLSRS